MRGVKGRGGGRGRGERREREYFPPTPLCFFLSLFYSANLVPLSRLPVVLANLQRIFRLLIKQLGVNDCKLKHFEWTVWLCHKMYSICKEWLFSLQTPAPSHLKIFYVLLDLRTLAIKTPHV